MIWNRFWFSRSSDSPQEAAGEPFGEFCEKPVKPHRDPSVDQRTANDRRDHFESHFQIENVSYQNPDHRRNRKELDNGADVASLEDSLATVEGNEAPEEDADKEGPVTFHGP